MQQQQRAAGVCFGAFKKNQKIRDSKPEKLKTFALARQAQNNSTKTQY
jgi:hypothetical protein